MLFAWKIEPISDERKIDAILTYTTTRHGGMVQRNLSLVGEL
jgi:hypothetical protein